MATRKCPDCGTAGIEDSQARCSACGLLLILNGPEPEAAESPPPELTVKDADHWRQMRAIMYQPGKVWLATQANGDRWLTDMFVLLKITGSEDFQPFPDGPYKLTVSKGPEARDAQAWPYIEGYLTAISGRDWKAAVPTDWSVAEDEVNKARLWSAEGDPCLFGESTWAEIRRYHPEAHAEYSYRGNGLFRFFNGNRALPFAYAAGVRIPDGNEVSAKAIVSAL